MIPTAKCPVVWRYMPYFSYPKAPNNTFKKLYFEELHP